MAEFDFQKNQAPLLITVVGGKFCPWGAQVARGPAEEASHIFCFCQGKKLLTFWMY
jgi:hypothetical protein